MILLLSPSFSFFRPDSSFAPPTTTGSTAVRPALPRREICPELDFSWNQMLNRRLKRKVSGEYFDLAFCCFLWERKGSNQAR